MTSTQISRKTNKIEDRGEVRFDVETCKLKIKALGISDEKVDLLEKNIRAIINRELDKLENGK